MQRRYYSKERKRHPHCSTSQGHYTSHATGNVVSKSMISITEYAVLYLTDSKLTPRHFYNGLLEQLGLETWFYRGDARKKLHQEIEIMRGVSKRKLVVIVDEGHLLSKEMLEEIRFLMNYKMDSEHPLALILAGQTELWDKLKM